MILIFFCLCILMGSVFNKIYFSKHKHKASLNLRGLFYSKNKKILKNLKFLYNSDKKKKLIRDYFWCLTPANLYFQKTLYYFFGNFIVSGFFISKLLKIVKVFTEFLQVQSSPSGFPLNLEKNTSLINFLLIFKDSFKACVSDKKNDFKSIFTFLELNIKMYYKVVFISLSRRMKKIIKNKYKFRRQYICVLPSSRVRYGLHLLKFCLKFVEGYTWQNRLFSLISSFFLNNNNVIFYIKSQQQKKVLHTLKKKLL